MKKYIIGFILGLIVASGVGVVAYNYNASSIEYTPSDNTWNVNNVSDAIDWLKNNGSIEIISYDNQKTGTVTISPPIGSYIVCVGVSSCISSLGSDSSAEHFESQMASINGYGIWANVYKVTESPVTLKADDSRRDFGYIVFK